MKIKFKVFIAFLIPTLLFFATIVGLVYYFEIYRYFYGDQKILWVAAATAVIYILLLFLVSKLVESMVNRPISKLKKKSKILYNRDYAAYKIEDNKGDFKEVFDALDTAVTSIEKYRVEINTQIEQKNKDMDELNKKLKVDEEAAVKVFQELKEIDKMKSDFISLASHQLRTPLLAIKWGIEILLKGELGPLQNDQEEYALNIHKSNIRLIDLVNNLLNVSRIESGRFIIDPKPTNLDALAKDVVSEIKIKADNKNQKIDMQIHGELPEISIDPALVRHVYMNLFTNALKYSHPGDTINIELAQNDEAIVTKVEDHGIGIPEKDQHRMFEKFYRTDNAIKSSPEGTGLGLYLAKAIVEALGGIIWFESIEGKGATFYFSLPKSGVEKKEGEVTIT